MGRSLDRGMVVGIGLIVALLVVTPVLNYYNTQRLKEDAGQVIHTLEVIELTSDLMLALVDAETGQRGFLLTGKDEFLEPYDAALSRLNGLLAALKNKTQDNQSQQDRIKELEGLIAARVDMLKEGIALRRHSAAEAESFIAHKKGKEQMDAVRDLVARMRSHEHELLTYRQERSDITYTIALTSGLLAAIVGLAMVAAFVRLLDRSLESRQQAAAVIQQQRELFRTTLASIGDAVITTDTNGHITFLNPVACSLSGWKLDEAKGQPLLAVFRIINEQTRKPAEDPASRALREGMIVGLANHTVLVARDGTERPIDDSAAPIRDEAGKVAGVVLVFRDVSERRRVERALHQDLAERKRVEQSLRFLADASAALTTLVDYESTLQKVAGLAVPHFADWCVVDMIESDGSVRRLAVAHADPQKARFARELQQRYPRDPNVPGDWPQVLLTGRAELVSDIPDAALVQSAKDQEHLRILRELGLRSYMSAPLHGRGKLLGMISFVSAESGRRYTEADLAFAEELARRAAIAIENAQLYAALRDADRRKDEFLATLAHELRNPLAPIRTSVEVLRRLAPVEPQLQQVREMIDRQVRNMVRLVDDLLEVSRITRGMVDLQWEAVDLAKVTQDAIETSGPAIEAGRHEVTFALPPEPVIVRGDLIRLTQVVANLLNNAAKYTPLGGHIWLTVERQDSEGVIRVRDNGAGIPAEMLTKVFELFTQVNSSLKRAQGGLGIGLALVKRLVEMHGGRVEAHSEGEGKGSEFVVHLPLATAQDVPDEREEKRPAATFTPRRVLVVDDHVDAADSLSLLLSMSGHEVRTAYDGRTALEQAAQLKPDMIFLDLGMPGIDGYETARKVRELQGMEHVRLVALTGWGQDEDRRRTQEAGFDAHLVKPVNPTVLQEFMASTQGD
jgi:PAS domain S-box-containing protein